MIRNCVAAPKIEMAPVPSMYPPSTLKARLPAASTYDRRPGSTRSRKPRQNVVAVAHEVVRQQDRQQQHDARARRADDSASAIVPTTPAPNVWTSVDQRPALPPALSSADPAPATAWPTRSLDWSRPATTMVRPTMMVDHDVAPERRAQGRSTATPAAPLERCAERRERRRQDDAEHERHDHDRDLDGGRDDDGEQADRRRAGASSIGRAGRARSARAPFAAWSRASARRRGRTRRAPDDGQREGDDRDGREQADDPGQRGARRQGDEHERRMDVDRLVVDDRGQELALDERQRSRSGPAGRSPP